MPEPFSKLGPIDAQPQPQDGDQTVNAGQILRAHLAEADKLYADAHPAPQPKQSYLAKGLDRAASLVISDEHTREQVSHYGSEFLKTGSLFARGKLGVAATLLVYGFDKACPDDTLATRATDFTLGAAKGQLVKSVMGAVSRNYSFAPTKGVLIGIASRDAEIIFDRETFTNPSRTIAKLKAETVNPQAWAYDAAVFGVAEGAFSGVNRAMGGKLVKNATASGMFMGGSFGAVNGGTSEIMRQQAEGKEIDWSKVAYKGLIEAVIGTAAAGVGIKSTDAAMHARVNKALGNPSQKVERLAEHMGLRRGVESREFVVVGGKEQLDAFTAKHESAATLNVREVTKLFGLERLGASKTLFVQRLGEGPPGLRPAAQNADLLATCFPETLPAKERANHVFPNSKGIVWLEAGGTNRLKLATGKTPWEHRNYNPIGKIARLDGHQITMNVMGPLEIGNIRDPHDAKHQGAWENFSGELARAKKLGADAVSTDVWWGAIEPKPGQFSWNYYDLMSTKIAEQGLKWVPILSLHACGGNVGDTANVPIPMWIWGKVQAKTGSENPDVGKFKSEQGNVSSEYVSYWATQHALPFYRNVMSEFQNHFAGKAHNIAEINVSLGPAGELRFPSYNSHDQNSGWPTRGALQAYSDLARQSWRDYAIAKYGSETAVKQAWGEKYGSTIEPPKNPTELFESGDFRNSQYGKDFFDWYSTSLRNHGDMVLSTALDVFGNKGSAFAGIDIGAKIPGVHWRMGEWRDGKIVLEGREAELSAGLISTSKDDWNDAGGYGYRPLLTAFKELQLKSPFSRVIPHFTALELPDGQDGPIAKSLPNSLAKWVGREANQQGLLIKGENALAGTLYDGNAWTRMASLLKGWGNNPNEGQYDGLTFLRMSDVLASEVAQRHFAEILSKVRPTTQELAKVAQ